MIRKPLPQLKLGQAVKVNVTFWQPEIENQVGSIYSWMFIRGLIDSKVHVWNYKPGQDPECARITLEQIAEIRNENGETIWTQK